jgi:hypothetical protein
VWQSYCFSPFFHLFSPLLQLSSPNIWQFHIFALSLQCQNLNSGTKKQAAPTSREAAFFCAIKRERVRPQYTTAPRGHSSEYAKATQRL